MDYSRDIRTKPGDVRDTESGRESLARADPQAHRLLPGVAGDATFRHCCEGWGLIQLYYGGPFGTQQLRWSHTNHNTEKRALAWAATTPRLGDPGAWDWEKITSGSSKLNRAIRTLTVNKIGSHPVLQHAAEFIEGGGLRYEYGTGTHAVPSFGMASR